MSSQNHSCTPARGLRLRWRAIAAARDSHWHDGIRGLCLRLDKLREWGVSASRLSTWREGHRLSAVPEDAKYRRNHPSLVKHSRWADMEWTRLESLGKIEFFPVGAPRPSCLNVNPCALLLKRRQGVPDGAPEEQQWTTQLIVNILGGGVNRRLAPYPVAYGTVEKAVSKLKRGSYMFVVDLADCFFNWRVHPDSAWELGFYAPSRKQFGRFLFLAFGLGPSPGINDESLKVLLDLFERRTGKSVVDFVDDLFGAAEDLEAAWIAMEELVQFFIDVGVPVSTKPGGLRFPSQVQTWCGWAFDTVRGILGVTDDKIAKAIRLIDAVLAAHTSDTLLARSLSECVGLLSHIGEVFLQGRRRLHALWADLNASGVYALWAKNSSADAAVTLSAASVKNLHWWLKSLQYPIERPLFEVSGSFTMWTTKSPDFDDVEMLSQSGEILVIETDASSLMGWSYHICSSSHVVSGTWDVHTFDMSINWKELWVPLQVLLRETERLRGWRVLFRIDNKAAVHYVNVRYGDIPELEQLAEALEVEERRAGCVCLAKHIPGKFNVIADAGSRDLSFSRRWNSDVFKDAILRPRLFEQLQSDLGSFDIDLFADVQGHSSLCPRWCHASSSAFECPLDGFQSWAHPPRALVGLFLAHVRAYPSPVRVAVLVPCDAGAPWFRPAVLRWWQRRQCWPVGSDLFRIRDAEQDRIFWRKCRRTDFPYVVLTS